MKAENIGCSENDETPDSNATEVIDSHKIKDSVFLFKSEKVKSSLSKANVQIIENNESLEDIRSSSIVTGKQKGY